MKRVLVCGGRDFSDRDYAFSVLDGYYDLYGRAICALIHGDAPGADQIGDAWARRHDIPVLRYPALWKIHGRAAGPIRNQQMLDEGYPDVVFAFPGGRGTADMVRRARAQNVEVVLLAEARKSAPHNGQGG